MDSALALRDAEEVAQPTAPVALPALLGGIQGPYRIKRSRFLVSALLHVVAVSLLVTLSPVPKSQQRQTQQQVVGLVTDISPYVLPPSPGKAGGGGGGGDRDKLPASRGALPKFSRQQITPPAAVVRNPNPQLAVEPTAVVPPEIHLPQTGPLGDPLSAVLGPPSNGPRSGGGIASGSGGGVGSGYGPGVGPGYGGGIGGGVYRIGGGVSAPRLIYGPDPQYSEEARKAMHQGTVVLWVIEGTDGRTHDIRVQRPLGMGLDQKAVEAVRTWKFEPARKNGQIVAVLISIEVEFRLY